MRTLKIYSLSNFQICNTVLLTIVTMLYIRSPWLIYFINGSLYLLTTPPSPISLTAPSPPCPWQPPVYSLYLWTCSFWCFLDSTYKWDHIVFVLLCLTSLSIMPSRSIHVVANGKISFILWLSNIPCIYRPHFLYPFNDPWTLCLFPCLGYHK